MNTNVVNGVKYIRYPDITMPVLAINKRVPSVLKTDRTVTAPGEPNQSTYKEQQHLIRNKATIHFVIEGTK